MKAGKNVFLPFGLLAATLNLSLSYYFNVNAEDLVLSKPLDTNWFFLGEPAFNYGGFFVSSNEPTIYRLPSTIFLIILSIALFRYLMHTRTVAQSLFAAILLGGVGGLTLDILAYGSVCDWLGFKVPEATIYSMTNISDLMILVSAPIAALICVKGLIARSLGFCTAIAIVSSSTYYHFAALGDFFLLSRY
ncbi:signal peptidase II [Candidatus Ponderosibacter sp. Uisw_141_02]|uniref:signal peptidase II n=1 Tax=Candidatus Ponderosibacter sp. Uisw_141_02 TaxID=3231000 RepID=UPI003D43E58D